MLLISIGALAAEPEANSGAAASDPAVAALKSRLPSTYGFEVDNIRKTGDGIACINYRVANELGGETRAQAVVKGDEVLRSTTRNAKFAKAWNAHCAAAG